MYDISEKWENKTHIEDWATPTQMLLGETLRSRQYEDHSEWLGFYVFGSKY